MQTATYPDGFPLQPLAAINQSYFLSESEREEWKQWVTYATPEQQQELVETLHAMWVEHQKNAIPSGFNVQSTNPIQSSASDDAQSSPSTSSTPTQSTQYTVTDEDTGESTPLSNTFASYNSPPSQAVSTTPKPQSSFTKKDEEALMNFANRPYSPSPILETTDSTNTVFTSSIIQTNDQTGVTSIQSQPSVTTSSDNTHDSTRTKDVTQPTTFFSVTNIRESATKEELEELYRTYIRTREESFQHEYRYRDAQGRFLDKVIDVVVNFEKIADFFDSVTQKLIEMNDRLLQQVKDYQDLKTTLNTRQKDLEDAIEEIRRDVDRMYREIKENKQDTRTKFQEIDSQLAQASADVYRQDGLLQRLDLVMSRLHKLELQFKKGDMNTSLPFNKDATTNEYHDTQRPPQSNGPRKISLKPHTPSSNSQIAA